MKTILAAFILLMSAPIAGMAAGEPSTGTESGPPGAGPPGYQNWPGHTLTVKEQAPEKHVSAGAAHEQAAAHHKAAAAALQAGNPEQAKEHAAAAEKAAAEAYAESKGALTGEKAK